MRKKIILCFLSLCCMLFASAQRYQVTTGTNNPEEKWAVVEDPATANYVAIGNVTINNISEVWISSYAPNGTLLTSARASNNRRMIARDICLAPRDPNNGNPTYYVTGWTQTQLATGLLVNQMFVGRIDLAGAFLWYQENPFAGNGNDKEGIAVVTEPVTMDVVALGIVQWPAAGGVPAGPRVILTRFGPAGGAPIWSNVYNLPGNWMPREIDLGVPSPGCAVGAWPGNFVITGEAVVPPAAAPQTFVAAYNGGGVECWRNLYPAAATGFVTQADAGYDIVWHPQSGNYCVVGVAQTGPVRAAATSTPYMLNINPAGAIIGSAVYTTPTNTPLGLYPRCVSLGMNNGQVVFAGPDFGAGRTFWGMIAGIAPFPAGPLNNYAGPATANSVGQPFVLTDAWPEDILTTNLGTLPGYLISTNAVPGVFGAGDGHFIRTNLGGQTPDSCRETRKTNKPVTSLRRTPQTSTATALLAWGNVPTVKNQHNVKQQFCRDTCIVTASYTYAQTGTTVNFTGSGSGNGIITYSWDFGDGSPLDPTPNPTHTYTGTAAYYIACLTVTNTNASNITCKATYCDTIFLCNVQAGFSYADSCKTVTFTNSSTGVTYSWDFGDGNTSSATNPVHTYAACGTYNVRLVACNGACCDTTYQIVAIPCCAVKSDFCMVTYGTSVTLNVNTSVNPGGTTYDVYVDGVSTPWPNNTSQVLSAGAHTICVKATGVVCGDTCCATSCKTIGVSDTCTLKGDFWFQVQSGGNVSFTDQSTPGSNSYSWDFGDGGTSTSANPSHAYASTGTYTACLTVRQVNGADTCEQKLCKTVVVDAPCAVQAQFSALHCISSPLKILFTNMSTGSPVNYIWDFGDGSPVDLSASPVHNYAAPGTYIVCLKAVVNGNCWYRACYSVIVSTVTGNNDCHLLPPNPLYRLVPLLIMENKTTLIATDAGPGIAGKTGEKAIIDEMLQPGKMILFPNPAAHQVQAVFIAGRQESSEIVVLNAAGSTVYRKATPVMEGRNLLTIPVDQLPGGMYLVRLKTSGGMISGNFFVHNR